MSISAEELAAFADGELDAERHAVVAAAVTADPELADQVRMHRALKERLSAHFAPVLTTPLPENLVRSLQSPPDNVASFAAARQRQHGQQGNAPRRVPRWTWLAAPALAASLAVALFLPRVGEGDYASTPLAETLDGQLVATQDMASSTRILLSFRDEAGSYCRAFATTGQSGIACRDDQGWRVVFEAAGIPVQGSDYRMAGNPAATVLERVQEMSAGPALNAVQEQAARDRQWR